MTVPFFVPYSMGPRCVLTIKGADLPTSIEPLFSIGFFVCSMEYAVDSVQRFDHKARKAHKGGQRGRIQARGMGAKYSSIRGALLPNPLNPKRCSLCVRDAREGPLAVAGIL